MSEKIQLVADESVDASIVEGLREKNYSVYSIAEQQPSISDDKVLSIANEFEVFLITEDKDFGELVIRLHKKHHGILLIRLSGIPTEEKATMVGKIFDEHFAELQNSFAVLDHNKLRIRNFS